MISPNICDICKQEKEVCCGFEGKNPADRYCFCKACCPNKTEHEINRKIEEQIRRDKIEYVPTWEERMQKLEGEVEDLKQEILDIKYRYVMRDDIDE